VQPTTEEKMKAVAEALRKKEVLVAFSGGVDSTVLAAIALEHARRVVLLTVLSEVFSSDEKQRAERVANELGAEHLAVDFSWLDSPGLSENATDRCYSCKKALSLLWKKKAEELGLELVVEGTTASEAQGQRPGMAALREEGTLSPFIEADVTKSEIRGFAAEKGLSVAGEPSMACLATRFPHGTEITNNLLRKIESIEEKVRTLFDVECVRARYHGDIVRIEVGQSEIEKLFDPERMKKLDSFVKSLGFGFSSLDLGGYRTGSMDET
jgi:uncharacterized protein